MNLLQAAADPKLFAPWFRDRVTWAAWFAFLNALFGLPLTPDEVEVYRRCTGRVAPPAAAAREAWLICGRRAGKSFVLALIAVYLACFREYRGRLTVGERATVLIIATDRRQARVILGYVRGLLTGVPMLARMVTRETADAFELEGGLAIEVGTASFRSVRGYTIAAALLDELAFWPTDEDAADPDYAVLDAIRPGMATIPGAMLLCASSPYARRGALFETHQRHWGRDGDPVLVWQAPTLAMNPTVPRRIVDEAMERDEASARAEWMAEFRTDVEGFISREAIAAVVPPGVRERGPLPNVRYSAFVDPSGGSADSMTLAVAHQEARVSVLDAVREVRPPFSPETVVRDFVQLLRRYRVTTVRGDRYAGEWPREVFRRSGITYDPSADPKSDIYRSLLPLVNSREVSLLDDERLTRQLLGLERRTARGGRDSIDHGPGAHDDVANAVAGAVVMAANSRAGRAGMKVLGGPYGMGDPARLRELNPPKFLPDGRRRNILRGNGTTYE